jgi:PLP dependent protein
MPDPRLSRLARNLAEVRRRIAVAAQRGGRMGEDVLLVAVTKYVDAPVARALVELGCSALGESRPQSLWQKAESLRDIPVHWHLIGHLQRNKIRRTVPWVRLLHSVDSTRLLDALQEEALRTRRRIPVLLEVNIASEPEKTGFTIPQVSALPERLGEWSRLEFQGMMAMSGRSGDLDEARCDFQRLRALRDTLQPRCPEEVALRHLSMGMSADYEVAIEEGATIVRVGSALFEGIDS